MSLSRVFLSYVHESPEFKEQVRRLADRLRGEGVDCHLDQYEAVPPANWPRWMLHQIESADYVLMVCSPTYARRFVGQEEPGRGLGSQWEGAIILQNLYEGTRPHKYIPVVLSRADKQHIPVVLRGGQYYDLSAHEGYDELYRRLTGQAAATRPELGPLRSEGPAPIYGIDLGTTHCCVAVCDEQGNPVAVPNADGEATTPSLLFFESPERVVVGRAARQALATHPDRVAALFKREMGQGWHFEAFGRRYAPEELSALLLRKLAEDASRSLGRPVSQVVITCPAYFGNNERGATRVAGELAGLTVHQVLNEPTAAALSYGLSAPGEQSALVYDLGGGTFDVTVLLLREGNCRVVATGGDFRLGGRDWDDLLADHLAAEFRDRFPQVADPRDDSVAMAGLVLRAEQAKRTLSEQESACVEVACAGRTATLTVTRARFEELTAPLLERTLEMTLRVLEEANGLGVSAVDQVLLVGGSSRMPAVARRLHQVLGSVPRLYDPDLAVARGAALWGRQLLARRLVQGELAAQSGRPPAQGVLEDSPGLARAAREVAQKHESLLRLPARQVEELARTRVVNVASKAFGVVARNRQDKDEVCHLIGKNAPLPAERTRTFGTHQEGQPEIVLKVMEQSGERESPLLTHNRLLGEGVIAELPARLPAGSPVHVTFRLAEDGTLSVAAVEPASGKQLSMTLRIQGVLAPEEVAPRRGSLQLLEVT